MNSSALRILADHMEHAAKALRESADFQDCVASQLPATALLSRPIRQCGFSVRARKAMTRMGVETLGQLVNKSSDDLAEQKNCGISTIHEVHAKLITFGLRLQPGVADICIENENDV